MTGRVGVKICGLADAPSLDAAVAGGARRVGFVFFPPSPRALAIDAAAALARRVPGDIDRVGVFVEPGDDLLAAVTAAVPLTMIQLHGRESAARAAQIRARFGLPVIKALAVAGAADLAAVAAYEGVADWLMFDAKTPKDAPLPGGMGLAFDWRLLAGLRTARPWLLSGGLTPDNVGRAIAASGAAHVDVSSGVETAPGRKDPALIRAFLAAVEAAGAGGGGGADGRLSARGECA